jgi:hypothetical protein
MLLPSNMIGKMVFLLYRVTGNGKRDKVAPIKKECTLSAKRAHL